MRRILILAVIAAVQGLTLLGYAIFDIYGAITIGTTGPEEVSNAPALALQIVIFAGLGAGMVFVAYGWWRRRRWARAPFIVVQFLAIIIGWPLAQALGLAERAVGVALVALAIIGLFLAFTPRVTRELEG
jgi:hypothetical protein